MSKQPAPTDKKPKTLSDKMAETGNAYRDDFPLTDAECEEAENLRHHLLQVAETHEARLQASNAQNPKKPRR